MNRFNKLTACFLSVAMSLTSAAFAADEAVVLSDAISESTELFETMSVNDGGWTVSEYNGEAIFNDTQTDIKLHCKTQTRTMASVEAISPIIDTDNAENGVISMSFSLSASGFSTNHTALISAYNASDSYAANLFRLNGTTLTVFGGDTVTLEENEVLNIKTVFDIDAEKFMVSINDETVLKGQNTNISYLNKNEISLQLQSYWTRSIVSETVLEIKELSIQSDKAFSMNGLYANGNQIGKICTITDVQDGISLLFDGIGSADMYVKENYEVKVNGEDAGFNVAEIDGGIKFIFDVPLATGDNVSVCIKKAEDIFGTIYGELQTTSFTIADSNYIAPALEINCDRAEFVLGETAPVSIAVTGSAWTDVKLYVNDQYIDYFEQEQFIYGFKPDNEGTYKIKATVSDEYDAYDETELTVVFLPNNAPTVSFEGFTDGESKSYSVDDAKNIHIIASDDIELTHIDLYLNGALVRSIEEDEYIWNLDNDGILLGTNKIKAVAFDKYGRSGAVSAVIEVTKRLTVEILSESTFSESGGKYGSGMSITREKGFVKTATIDAEHGDSMVFGMNEMSTDTGNYTHINASTLISTYSKQQFEFDLYVDEAPLDDAGVTLGVRRSNGVVEKLFAVNSTTFQYGGDTFEYTPDTWYRIKLSVSFEKGNQYFDVYINGELKKSKISANFSDAPTNYRFYTTTNLENLCSVAVDNIRATGEADSFTITGVSNSSDGVPSKEITPAGNEFYIHIEGFVVTEDLNKENVSLFKGNLKENIKRIGYDLETNTITVETENALSPNSQYSLHFSENIRIVNDVTIQSPMQISFKTLSTDITVEEISKRIKKQDCEISFAVSNVSDAEKEISVFATVFDNGRFVKTDLFDTTVPPQSENANFSFTVSDSADKEIQVFVTDGINVVTIYKTIMFE